MHNLQKNFQIQFKTKLTKFRRNEYSIKVQDIWFHFNNILLSTEFI